MALIDMIAAERVAVADMLESLDDTGWATPSLCGEWTVREVAAHLIQGFEITMLGFAKAMIRFRGNFDRANADFAKRIAAAQSNEYIIATLRENRYHPFTPPTGAGLRAPLTDVVVHGQDMRRPLGLARDFESATVGEVLNFLTTGKSRGFVKKGLLDGLSLRALDGSWESEATGGALVSGTPEALIMSLVGRPVALGELSGPGVGELRQRLVGA